MRILILGSTGPSGIELVRECITVYPTSNIVLYVRSPQKIPADLSSHAAVSVVVGQLTDGDALGAALVDVDVVLSALGPTSALHPTNTPLTHAYESLIDLMHAHHVRRILLLSTTSVSDPLDKFSATFAVLVGGSRGADLDWTLVRVPILTKGDLDGVQLIAGYVGDGKTGAYLARKGFARFMVAEIEKREWIGKRPLICTK
ncbi:hypothetical protein BD779DRAFT_1666329 [Infundibulicybe gibba]|nr:hypothetical protein BD779DRAFT_1666329 [Infundibulicybe gibba]